MLPTSLPEPHLQNACLQLCLNLFYLFSPKFVAAESEKSDDSTKEDDSSI